MHIFASQILLPGLVEGAATAQYISQSVADSGAVSPAPTFEMSRFSVRVLDRRRVALNLAPFGRWTLRDKAAQRRLAPRSIHFAY